MTLVKVNKEYKFIKDSDIPINDHIELHDKQKEYFKILKDTSNSNKLSKRLNTVQIVVKTIIITKFFYHFCSFII